MRDVVSSPFAVELVGVDKRFGAFEAVRDVSLSVGKGEICVLIGPSGCGKTTTLKMINRVVPANGGTIRVRGEDIESLDPVRLRRSIGYVIQQVGLFPHMSVGANIALPLRLAGEGRARRRARAAELLTLVGLSDALIDRHPAELSGGQQQRVGVARALAADPDIVLMDEPFGAVDPLLRPQLQSELKAIQRRLGKTIILVTHDLSEAFALADSIVLMDEGRVVQQASPRDLLLKPSGPFVQRFLQQVGASEVVRLTEIADLPRAPVDLSGPAMSVPASTTLAALLARFAAGEPLPARIDLVPAGKGPVAIAAVFDAIVAAIGRADPS
ncbi:ATP-binding cassette domain-containing protein [Acuticoccus kandeliae]|uniref:ATP-binding cassette domain-containing protein n=1 Tax=Acuticoccus kandeliae TaxID=2073160 RepID=UPI000D3E0DB0|nr:ATP-binding cassette domain-containing protein [Acuticoccus kandeliae]